MNENDMVSITLSHASAKSWLGDLRENIAMLDVMHKKDPNYPAIGGYFKEFPHIEEMIAALESALSETAAVGAESA